MDAPRPTSDRRCKAVAQQRGTDETFYCQLRAGHKDTHFWTVVVGDERRSCSWYGPDDGLPMLVGPSNV